MNNFSTNNGGFNNRRNAQTNSTGTFLRPNPVMNRLNKVDEKGAANSASYSGIMIKTIYFLLMTIVGIVVYIALKNNVFAGGEQLTFNIRNFTATVPTGALISVAVVAVAAVIFQLIAAFAPVTIPVTGTIYSAAQGYIISFVVFSVLGDFSYLGAIALVITFIIVLTMGFLYATGKVRASKKLMTVILCLVIGMLAFSLLSLIGFLIPFTRPLVAMFIGNPVISFVMTLVSIVLATLFLISDFAMIQSVVENKLPAKYEWMASFGLVFTILWLYVKILDLLMQIVGNNKN